ncbi:5'-nucleotidase C-terminal domain-containing protein [Myxococcaceae bacterium GXIMD 01537]
MRRTSGALALALAGTLAGCEKTPAPAAPPPAEAPAAAVQAPPPPKEVTLLVTGATNGQLQPSAEGEQPSPGAADLMGRWVADEKHCAGPLKDGKALCDDAGTLALATGDHWNGPAISSFFVGQSTASVMGHLGYAASALGNHEFAFGKEQFLVNRKVGGFPFLAANLKATDAAMAKDLEVPAFQVFERRGLKVGVVGLTSVKTVKAAMAGRADGLEVTDYEQALSTAVPEAWKAGADVVAVVADVCASELQPAVEKHPEWKLALVAGGRCPQPVDAKVGATQVVSLGRGYERYLRAHITFDASKPAGEKVTAVETKLVDVKGATPDADTAKLVGHWKGKLDEVLGEEIGFTKKGIAQDSPEMGRWLAGAVRASLKTDLAILNRKGVRGALAAGKLTRGSVYSVMPFENTLLIAKLKGEDLVRQLANPEAVFSGATAAGKGKFKDAAGKAIDPKREYTVATVEYLYFGGDGFEFEKLDAMPTETGMAWQTPVIEWTKAQASTDKKPLEKALVK